MATYLYECPKCNEQEEHEHSMKICPIILHKCNTQMKKIIQPISIAFVGQGFHINDYKPTHNPKEKNV